MDNRYGYTTQLAKQTALHGAVPCAAKRGIKKAPLRGQWGEGRDTA